MTGPSLNIQDLLKHLGLAPPSESTGTTATPFLPPKTFVDSLNAVTGKPAFDARSNSTLSKSTDGQYLPLLDRINVRTQSPTNNPKIQQADLAQAQETRAHEAGHRTDPTIPLNLSAWTSPDHGGSQRAFAVYLAQHPEEQPTGYAATSPYEHYASAFSQAIGHLRNWDSGKAAELGLTSPDKSAYRAQADRVLRMDGEIPGTSAIVDHLLTTPLYANHPFRQSGLPSWLTGMLNVKQDAP